MARVFVPTMLQAATGGVKEVEVEGRNVRQIIDGLDELFPGIAAGCWKTATFVPTWPWQWTVRWLAWA